MLFDSIFSCKSHVYCICKTTFFHLKKQHILGLSRFVDLSQLVDLKIKKDIILLMSTNWKNTGSGAFHERESIRHIIRLFSKAA